MQSDRKPLVVLVGHCGPDSWALRSAVGRAVPEAQIVAADDGESLASHLPGADLLLVNRVLESGTFESQSGLDLIEKLAPTGIRCMLVSNFGDAQASAEAAGAQPGFGKTAMNSPEAAARIRAALGIAQA